MNLNFLGIDIFKKKGLTSEQKMKAKREALNKIYGIIQQVSELNTFRTVNDAILSRRGKFNANSISDERVNFLFAELKKEFKV